MRKPVLLPIIVVALVALAGTGLWATRGAPPAADEEQAVRALVKGLGERLKSVSLLAPAETRRREIREAYARFVSDELLATWLQDSAAAPGRLTSSPWPDRIEIARLVKDGDGYIVNGAIVSMTSVESVSAENDHAGTEPVTIAVAKIGGDWTVTAFERARTAGAHESTVAGPAGAFRLRYPADRFTAIAVGDDDAVRAGHYIPPCDEGFAACIVFSADTFAGTNFDSAGVAVFRTDAAAKSECDATKHGALRRGEHQDTINGRDFIVFDSGTAAMSHVARDAVYLTWQDDTCYELISRIAFSRFEVYEPGTIEEFTATAQQALRERLRGIVSTFELTSAPAE